MTRVARLLHRRRRFRDDSPVNPDVSYARNGNIAIAFEVVGTGRLSGIPARLHQQPRARLEQSPVRSVLDRWDVQSTHHHRSQGGGVVESFLSPEDLPPLEDLADDVTAVLDTVNSDRAALLGSSDCGSLCAMFARVASGSNIRVSPLRDIGERIDVPRLPNRMDRR